MATSQDVINAAYMQALGRPADPSGMQFYASQLESGAKSVGDIIADLNYAAATGVEDKAANQAITASGGWDFAPPPPPPSPSGGGGATAPVTSVTPLTAQDLYNQFLGGRPALEKDYKFWNDYIAKYGPDQAVAAFDAAAEQERNMDLAARAASLREQNLVREGAITAQDLYNQFLGGRSALQSDLDYWNNYIAVYGPDQARAAFEAAAQPEKKMPVEERVKSLRDQGLTVPGSLLGEFATQRKATPAEVRAMYLSTLSREPDPEGMAYWTSQPVENLRMRFYEQAEPEMQRRVAEIPVTTAIPKPLIGQVSPQSRGQSVDIPGSFVTTDQGAPKPLSVDISTMPRQQQDLTSFIVGKMPQPTTTPPATFSPENVSAQLELERLKAMNAPRITDQAPVAGFAQGGMVSNDINRLLQNQRQAMQRDSQSRQMLSTLGAPPVKKFSDGGPAGSSSGVRRLEMSGYQEGGEVSPMLSPEQLDEFNRNMQRELDEENRRFEKSGGPEFYSAIRPAMEDINERVKQTLELYRMGRATEADVQKLLPSLSEYEIASQFGRTDTGGYRSKDIGAPSRDRLREFIEIQKPTIDADRPDMFPYDPRGSKAQGRVLEMSKGGDVTNDDFIQEMMTGTRPTDFPETSPVDTAVSDFISSRSKLVTDPQEFFRVMGQNIEEYHGKPLREDPEKYLMEQLGPGALAGIIKMPGGNYLAGQVEKALAENKARIPWTDQQISEMPQVAKALEKDLALNKFIETKLTKYVKNDMATERDPLRLQADKWATEQQPKLLAEKDAQIAKAKADMEKAQRERGVDPEMLTRSRARILELEKEREFIASRTGLHYEPRPTPELYRGGVNFARQNQGFPSTAVARSEAGKLWEDLSDRFFMTRSSVEDVTSPNYFMRDTDAQRIMAKNPWLSQVPPETQVQMLNRGISQQDTGFKHMTDELRNALNPESGLPPSLQISPKDLEKMSVPQVADLVDRINAHRAVQKAEADKLAAQKSIEVYKEYPETEQGLRWVEIKMLPYPETLPEGFEIVNKAPKAIQVRKIGEKQVISGRDLKDVIDGIYNYYPDTPGNSRKALEEALKYEGDIMKHCVGGHCPEVISGESRIFSLRDSTGRPHATVEVSPDPIRTWDDVSNVVGPEEASRLWKEFSSEPRIKSQDDAFLEFIEKKGLQAPEKIKQIKGVLNKKPEDEYIPFVQDFVKSQRWSSVGDISNTGLIDLRDTFRALNVLGTNDVGELRRIREAIKSDYITPEELRKFRSPGGYAAGGEVTDFIKRAA